MNIKHLVLSGGGQNIFNYIGIFDYLFENNIIDMKNIESIYATSSGALIASSILLNYQWDDVKKYLINCNWETKLDINIDNMMNIISKNGIFDKSFYKIVYEPLLSGKDLSLDLTLEELYNISKIDFHVFTTELNNFEVCDISHSSHPNLKLLEALQMTSCFPLLIAPLCIEDKYYVDGGITNNYPLNHCIKNNNLYDNHDTILGIKSKRPSEIKKKLNDDSSFMDYVRGLLTYCSSSLSTTDSQEKIKNEILMDNGTVSFEIIINCIKNKDSRIELVNKGYDLCKESTIFFNESL